MSLRPKAPEINLDLCIGCGICTLVCPLQIIELEKERVAGIELAQSKIVSLARACSKCRKCTNECPAKAITM